MRKRAELILRRGRVGFVLNRIFAMAIVCIFYLFIFTGPFAYTNEDTIELGFAAENYKF